MKHCLYKKDFLLKEMLGSSTLGIDIAGGVIRAVSLKKAKGNTLVLRSSAKVAIPPTAFAGGDIGNAKELESALRLLKRKQKITYARASVPEEKVSVLDVTLPKVDKRKILESIRTRLTETFPSLAHADDMLINYEILSQDETSFHLNVAIARKSFVDEYLGILARAGFRVVSLELRSAAIAHALVAKKEKRPTMIVNIEEGKLSLFVMHDGFILSGIISQLPSRRDFKTIKEKIDAEYIAWHKLTPGAKIESVILAGSGAAETGLQEYLETSLRLKVELANVWKNINSFDAYIPEIPFNESLGYHAAIGLALEDFR